MRSRRYTTRPRATNETPDLAANVATKEEILGMALLPQAHGAMRDESKPDTSFGSGSEKKEKAERKGRGGLYLLQPRTQSYIQGKQNQGLRKDDKKRKK